MTTTIFFPSEAKTPYADNWLFRRGLRHFEIKINRDGLRAEEPAPTPEQVRAMRPSVVAVIGCEDFGPLEPGDPGSARCPHCGAEGRYVYTAIMSDGATKGMMKGCLNSFVRDVCARQCETALKKRIDMGRKGGPKWLSRWDQQICDAVDALAAGKSTIAQLRALCQGIALQKRAWMKSKGYA